MNGGVKLGTLERLLNEHKYQLTTIYLKNIFVKNTNNKEEYERLVEFLFDMCTVNIPINEKEMYLNEAEVATTIFSENMKLTDENLQYIASMFSRIRKLRRRLLKEITSLKEQRLQSDLKNNEQVLEQLFTAQYELTATKKTKGEFNQQLRSIQMLDQALNFSLLTAEQKKRYEEMADLMQQTVESFLANEEHHRIKMYNQAAIKSFKKANELFRVDSSFYQANFNNLRSLCESYLCIYDEKYLMSTAMMYFNLVYSEILSNLGTDEMKYFMTELSIMTPKKSLDEVK